MKKRTILASATAITAGALLALAVPLAASAHVHVDPNQVAAGSDALLEFSVPTESATAVTNKITLTIPKDTPFADVSYVPVAGWTTVLNTETLATPIKGDNGEITEAVTTVVWTANPGSEIAEGQIGIFGLEVGNVPDTGSIVLAVDQSYSDGSVVSWNETSADAEHPAPVLYVNDPAPTDGGASILSTHSAAESTSSDSSGSTAGSPDVLARALGVGGLVVGVVGIIIGVTGRRKSAA